MAENDTAATARDPNDVWRLNPWADIADTFNSKAADHPVRSADIIKGFSSRVITLEVGGPRTEFQAHEAHLITVDFFKGALQGGFKEGREGRIKLPEESPSAVERFLLWLLCGPQLWDNITESLDRVQQLDVVIELIILADKWCVQQLSVQSWSFFWALATKDINAPDYNEMLRAYKKLHPTKFRLLPVHALIASRYYNGKHPKNGEASIPVASTLSDRDFYTDYLSYGHVLWRCLGGGDHFRTPPSDSYPINEPLCHLADADIVLIRGLMLGIVDIYLETFLSNGDGTLGEVTMAQATEWVKMMLDL